MFLQEEYDEEVDLYGNLHINRINYWNAENKAFPIVNLELAGHCLKITDVKTQEVRTIHFDRTIIMECHSRANSQKDSYTVTLMSDGDLMFLMSQDEFNRIDAYYAKVNSLCAERFARLRVDMLMSYVEKQNAVLAELFDNIDSLIDVTLRFLQEHAQVFLSLDNLLILEMCIENTDIDKYSSTLLSSAETRYNFKHNNQAVLQKNQEYVGSFFSNEFRLFQKLLQETCADTDVYSTYLFLINIVSQHSSRKWEDEHAVFFSDVNDVDIDTLIEKFCLLDDSDIYGLKTQAIFFYFLCDKKKFDTENKLFDNIDEYKRLLKHQFDLIKFNQFKNRLESASPSKKYSLDDVDFMNGLEFEKFLADMFNMMGYQTEITKTSGDQGIDVIAEKGGQRIGVQAKCYSSTVGNSAIQEAVAGKAFYKLDKVIVITNNFFSDSAIQLAQANGVVLWDRNLLKEKIVDVMN